MHCKHSTQYSHQIVRLTCRTAGIAAAPRTAARAPLALPGCETTAPANPAAARGTCQRNETFTHVCWFVYVVSQTSLRRWGARTCALEVRAAASAKVCMHCAEHMSMHTAQTSPNCVWCTTHLVRVRTLTSGSEGWPKDTPTTANSWERSGITLTLNGNVRPYL